MPHALIAIQIVAAVVGIGLAIKGAKDRKKAAQRAAGLEQEKLAASKRQRELEDRRNKALARKNARIRAAQIRNTAVGQGAGATSSVAGAVQAVKTGAAGVINFINQGEALQAQSDEITSRQIELSSETAQAAAITQGISGVVQGIGSIATAANTPAGQQFFNSLSSTASPAGGFTNIGL